MRASRRALLAVGRPQRASTPHAREQAAFFTWDPPADAASAPQHAAFQQTVDRMASLAPDDSQWLAAIEEGMRLKSVAGLQRLMLIRQDYASREKLVPLLQRALTAEQADAYRILAHADGTGYVATWLSARAPMRTFWPIAMDAWQNHSLAGGVVTEEYFCRCGGQTHALRGYRFLHKINQLHLLEQSSIGFFDRAVAAGNRWAVRPHEQPLPPLVQAAISARGAAAARDALRGAFELGSAADELLRAPDGLAANALLLAARRAKHAPLLLEALHGLEQRGAPLNALSLAIVGEALAVQTDPLSEASRLCARYLSSPSSATSLYNAVLTGAFEQRRFEMAAPLAERMESQGVPANALTEALLAMHASRHGGVGGSGDNERAASLLTRFAARDPQSVTVSAMARAWTAAKFVRQPDALQALYRLWRAHPVYPHSEALVKLTALSFAAAGSSDAARRVLSDFEGASDRQNATADATRRNLIKTVMRAIAVDPKTQLADLENAFKEYPVFVAELPPAAFAALVNRAMQTGPKGVDLLLSIIKPNEHAMWPRATVRAVQNYAMRGATSVVAQILEQAMPHARVLQGPLLERLQRACRTPALQRVFLDALGRHCDAGVSVDALGRALKFAIAQQAPPMAQRAFAERLVAARRADLPAHPHVIATLQSVFRTWRLAAPAKQLFDDHAKSHAGKVSALVLSATLQALTRAYDYDGAIDVCQRLARGDISADINASVYTSILQLYEKMGDYEAAATLLQTALSKEMSSYLMLRAVSVLCGIGDAESACAIAEKLASTTTEMRPKRAAYTKLLNMSERLHVSPRDLWSSAMRNAVVADAEMYAAYISALVRHGSLEHADAMYRRVCRTMDGVFPALVDARLQMLAALGETGAALAAYDSAIRGLRKAIASSGGSSGSSDADEGGSGAGAQGRRRLGSRAMWWRELQSAQAAAAASRQRSQWQLSSYGTQLVPLFATYMRILATLPDAAAAVQLAETTFRAIMPELSVRPDPLVYQGFVAVLARARETERAIAVYREMKAAPVTPTMETYESLFSLFGRQRAIKYVEEVYDDILARQLRLAPAVYEALVRDCKIDKLSVIMSVPADEVPARRTRRAHEVLSALTSRVPRSLDEADEADGDGHTDSFGQSESDDDDDDDDDDDKEAFMRVRRRRSTR